jgi:hypoxanthine phosphoribosyltransferase
MNHAQQTVFTTEPAFTTKGRTFGLDVLVTREMIENQVASLAAELRQEFSGQRAPLFCPILTGGSFFYHDLARALRRPDTDHVPSRTGIFPHEVAYVYARRYGMETQGEKDVQVDWFGFNALDITGRTLLVVDDILDEGLTVEAVIAGLRQRGATRIVTAFACRKSPPKTTFPADYVMFDVPAHIWCAGYGMDFRNLLRNALMVLDATPWLRGERKGNDAEV